MRGKKLKDIAIAVVSFGFPALAMVGAAWIQHGQKKTREAQQQTQKAVEDLRAENTAQHAENKSAVQASVKAVDQYALEIGKAVGAVNHLSTQVQSGFDSVNARLDDHGARITKLEAKDAG